MLDVKGLPKLERLFRVVAQLDVDKDDLQRCTDFVNQKLYAHTGHQQQRAPISRGACAKSRGL